MVPIDESSKRASNKYHGDDAQPTTSKRCNQQHFSHPYKRCGVNQYSPNILNKRVRFKTKDLFESSKSRPPFQRDLKGNTGCVNAAEISPNEEWIASGGDDKKVRIWKTVDCFVNDTPKPYSLTNTHLSNIFALRFSHLTDRVYSAGNDHRLIVHDMHTREKLRVFKALGPIYKISTHPSNDFIIAAASEEGCVHIFDQRVNEGDGCTRLKQQKGSAYSAEFCPTSANLVAVCGRRGLRIYDLRNGQDEYYAEAENITHAVSAEWSPDGKKIFCIRTHFNPLYLNLETNTTIQLKDPGYSNTITVKSCAFAGQNYVITGSDNWKIFIWKIDDDVNYANDAIDRAYTVLEGHRSVVNHVRFGGRSNLLLSCGVEKIVKCWSNFYMKDSYTEPRERIRGSIHDTRATPINLDSNGSDVEEDVVTLHHFDYYLEEAMKRLREAEQSGQSFSTDSEDGFSPYLLEDMDDSSSFDDEDDDVDILSQFSSSDVSAMTIEDDDNSANIVMNFNSSPRNTY